MNKCESCIHYEICADLLAYQKNVEIDKVKSLMNDVVCKKYSCDHFKDKSLVVELPCRCKDCIYYQCEKILMDNGELRDYTEQEIAEGKCVTMNIGINLGSRCLRHMYWKKNSIPVWFNDNDYCSYGKRKS